LFLRFILFPFSLIYGVITGIRNMLYDRRRLPSVRFDNVAVICVGNITVGGTGKTPHVEYLIRLLSPRYRMAVLSRGYKRKTRGFMLVETCSTARETGDEPCQIKQKYPHIPVAVDADRVHGVRKLLEMYPDLRVILLDDAFQHRRITPSLSILLADYRRPLYRDGMLPGGRLREWACFARRADMMIVTKTPDLSEQQQRAIATRYARIFPKSIYFSRIVYGTLCPVFPDVPPFPEHQPAQVALLLVTGIASPQPLGHHLRPRVAALHTLYYPDHHAFTRQDVETVTARLQGIPFARKYVVTTEKDAVRFRQTDIPIALRSCLYYVPITVELTDESAFVEALNSVSSSGGTLSI
jgi:tetraacyldisaccharide 4'-kinase